MSPRRAGLALSVLAFLAVLACTVLLSGRYWSELLMLPVAASAAWFAVQLLVLRELTAGRRFWWLLGASQAAWILVLVGGAVAVGGGWGDGSSLVFFHSLLDGGLLLVVASALLIPLREAARKAEADITSPQRPR